jgi:hypothetical protein
MKPSVLLSVALVGSFAGIACDGGSDADGCVADVECAPGYLCDGRGFCTLHPLACTKPSDCGINETCGSEASCRVGDCSFHGCVAGYSCRLVDARPVCLEGSVWTAGPMGAGGEAGRGGAAGSEN